MVLRLLAASVVAAIAFYCVLSAHAAQQGNGAAKPVVRLPVSAFAGAPMRVKARAIADGCLVPQVGVGAKEPNNVISGEFAAKGQRDWAILCSKAGRSSIAIYWGGSARCSALAAEIGSDVDLVKDDEGFAVKITTEPLATIRKVVKELRLQAPRLTHDGLRRSFDSEASSVMYCNAGKWVDLYGGD